jgi:deoxyribose-phosphate aldolase
MENGADFIKTSTGKVDVNATPVSAYVMCQCIKKYYEATGRKVGFKAAGGISEPAEALAYAQLAKKILGDDYVKNQTFRIGASRLTDCLVAFLT